CSWLDSLVRVAIDDIVRHIPALFCPTLQGITKYLHLAGFNGFFNDLGTSRPDLANYLNIILRQRTFQSRRGAWNPFGLATVGLLQNLLIQLGAKCCAFPAQVRQPYGFVVPTRLR